MLSFFPRDVLDEILNLIESVSEGFPSYFFLTFCRHFSFFYVSSSISVFAGDLLPDIVKSPPTFSAEKDIPLLISFDSFEKYFFTLITFAYAFSLFPTIFGVEIFFYYSEEFSVLYAPVLKYMQYLFNL